MENLKRLLSLRPTEITFARAGSPIPGRKDRCRYARFHSPKILVGNELHTRFGFARISAARPGDSRIRPAAIIETNAGKNIATVQFMAAKEAKAVHAQ